MNVWRFITKTSFIIVWFVFDWGFSLIKWCEKDIIYVRTFHNFLRFPFNRTWVVDFYKSLISWHLLARGDRIYPFVYVCENLLLIIWTRHGFWFDPWIPMLSLGLLLGMIVPQIQYTPLPTPFLSVIYFIHFFIHFTTIYGSLFSFVPFPYPV